MHPIPRELIGRPFTSATAVASGLSKHALGGRRFRRLFRGVYITADTELTFVVWLRAALLLLPLDAVISHTSAMALYGLHVRSSTGVLEFSTNSAAISRHDRVVLHRRLHPISRRHRAGLPLTGPERTFVDCATRLSFVRLVQLGDLLVHRGFTTVDALTDYAWKRHLDGVRRARRCVAWVRARSESPRETVVRLMLVFARLPEPITNFELVDAYGRFVARLDLAYARRKVAVEYDGQHHERDPRQRQRDRERRERIESLGWRVIIVTERDLLTPTTIPWRVFDALAARGYDGPPPHINASWARWFSPANTM